MGIQPLRVHFEDPGAVRLIAGCLGEFMHLHQDRQPVILCVGTDLSTGDSLGPLVGTWLQEHQVPLPIYGTLHEPVHAGNLEAIMERIRRRHPGGVILAVDAAFGRAESVGNVEVAPGPISPGKAVSKDLGQIGDVSIIGVVNIGGFMEYFVLQNTRLGLIWSMSRVIAQGIARWAATLPAIVPAAAVEA